MDAWQKLLFVTLGGGLGSAMRYSLSGFLHRWLGTGFPFGTWAVNILGSFLLGFLMAHDFDEMGLGAHWRLALTTGLMGGFTTYSTFNQETLDYFRQGSVGLAAANLGVTVFFCLLSGALGFSTGRGLTLG